MMPEKQSDAAGALSSLIDAMLTKKAAPKEKPTAEVTELPKVVSQWRDERIVYLVTHTTCKCGATSTQTNPIPFVRRFHPKRGVHEEPIVLAHDSVTLHLLPVSQEHRDIEIQNCHECLTEDTLNPAVQTDILHSNPLSRGIVQPGARRQ